MQNKAHTSWISLLPLVLFVMLFMMSSLFSSTPISPLFSCLVAIIVALVFIFPADVPFNKRIELFVVGSSHTTAIATCYILFLSAIFSFVVTKIGGTQAAVNIGMTLLPDAYILPGFFTIVSLFATAIGSSMGTIAAFLPIGLGLATQLELDPAFMAGLVVGGAMLGDNLSIISDTTIAATQTTGCTMRDKFITNFKLVLPAFIMTCAVLIYYNAAIPVHTYATETTLSLSDLLKVVPYLVLFVLAPCNIDVLALLVIAIISGMGIGIWQGIFTFTQSTHLLLEGFSGNSSIEEVIILVLFVAGLSYLIEYNGGITYLFEHISLRVKSRAAAELSVALLVFLVNMAVAINTIAILITGPVAKNVADKFGIARKRMASLIDITACICQGIIPYAPQLLLAGSLAKISSVSIMPYLYYQWFIALVTLGSIGVNYFNEKA